jgi:hypothetical protein
MTWKQYLAAILVAVIVSCGVTLGYHFIYVDPVDEALVKSVNKNTEAVAEQDLVDMQLRATIDVIVAYQSIVSEDAKNYRELVGKAFQEVITNFGDIEKRIETLERRHLEVIRALAVLQKKHWDPKKAAEASGLEWKE